MLCQDEVLSLHVIMWFAVLALCVPKKTGTTVATDALLKMKQPSAWRMLHGRASNALAVLRTNELNLGRLVTAIHSE